MSRSFAAVLLLLSGCTTTSVYYLPVDPDIGKEEVQPCTRVTYGYGVVALGEQRTLTFRLVPEKGGIRIFISTKLSIGQRLRLKVPTATLIGTDQVRFSAQFAPWTSAVHMAGGVTAYDETIPSNEFIEGKDRKLSESLSRSHSYNVFQTEALAAAPHAAEYTLVLPAFELESTVIPPRELRVIYKSDKTYLSCFT